MLKEKSKSFGIPTLESCYFVLLVLLRLQITIKCLKIYGFYLKSFENNYFENDLIHCHPTHWVLCVYFCLIGWVTYGINNYYTNRKCVIKIDIHSWLYSLLSKHWMGWCWIKHKVNINFNYRHPKGVIIMITWTVNYLKKQIGKNIL